MKKKGKSNLQNGSVMVVMIVSIAIMMILATSFLTSANYTYKFTKILDDGDSAFFAAESASKRWVSEIREKVKNPEYSRDIPYKKGKEIEFVKGVLNKVKGEGLLREIKVNGDQGRNFTCDFANFEVHKCDKGVKDGKSIITAAVGITSVSSGYLSESNSTFVTNNKRLYHEESIEFAFIEGRMYLTSAIVSIGDVMAKGLGYGTSVSLKSYDVIGDVISYGSFPEKTLNPKQYYYGGIMAIKNAKLNIDGNAYTRSFVRSGAYYDEGAAALAQDASEINVTRDILAQCIQTFANYSKIYTYRNAFTLDDIEINGEHSFIGINGSFFGLSDPKGGWNHDEASCVLNSSLLHQGLSDHPSTSRIVINEDLVIAGTAYKIDGAGKGLMELESAGLIYPENDIMPCYKQNAAIEAKIPVLTPPIPSPGVTPGPTPDPKAEISAYYIDYLKDSSIKCGYVNLIQAHNKSDRNDLTSIQNWKTNIENNSNSYSISGDPNGFRLPPSLSISGIVGSSIVGANNTIYWDGLNSGDLASMNVNQHNITRMNFCRDNFQLDGFLPSEIEEIYKYNDPVNGYSSIKVSDSTLDETLITDLDGQIKNDMLKFWAVYWNPKNICDWNEYLNYSKSPATSGIPDIDTNSDQAAYLNVMKENQTEASGSSFKQHIPALKELIEAKLNKLAVRTYPNVETEDKWQYKTTSGSIGTSTNIIDQAIKDIKNKFGTSNSNPHVTIVRDDISSQTNILQKNVKECVTSTGSINLLVCEDSNIDLLVDTEFNGVILTKGRVIVQKGGLVYGAVIATGRYKDDANKSTIDANGTGCCLNTILDGNPSDVTRLNDGDFAGVVLDSSSGSGSTDPKIDFYMGKGSTDDKLKNEANVVDDDKKIYRNWNARTNLLKAFKDVGVTLDSIF